MLFLASMGETGLPMTFFLNSHLGLSRLLRPKEGRRPILRLKKKNTKKMI